ncbi:MAG: membrane protein insertase YidC [Bacilli bacterium]|nr:membrane protein insertase YidC [Bacilli bacterium]
MKNKKIIFIILLAIMIFPLTGCTKYVKDGKTIITEEETGERLVSNILCKPTKESMLNLYEKYEIDISNLPECNDFKITSNGYEGVWTTIFVKPLALGIIKLTSLVKNAGLAIIIITFIIRGILFPITNKTAMQSEMMNKAKPEIDKIEKKYANKTSQQDQMAHSQEIMMVYKKYGINPMSGCIFALIQIPLFFAFYEAMNRLPLIFEGTFLGLDLGMSPLNGIAKGNYFYILIIILVVMMTFLSFKLNKTANTDDINGISMKMMTNMSIGMIAIASFTISTSIAIYWICNSSFTVLQNLLVKRGKKHA